MAFQGVALLALGVLSFAVSLYYIYAYNEAQEQTYGPRNSRNYDHFDTEGYEGLNSVFEPSDRQQFIRGRKQKRQSKSVKRRKIKTECTICLIKIESEETLLPCNHRFHTKCIENWKSQGPNETRYTCPNCRSTYLP